MRSTDKRSGELFSYVDLEQRVRTDHPLRAIRTVVREALDALSGEFATLYSGMGRPSIAPEMLLRAMLLQTFSPMRLRTAAIGVARHHHRVVERAPRRNRDQTIGRQCRLQLLQRDYQMV